MRVSVVGKPRMASLYEVGWASPAPIIVRFMPGTSRSVSFSPWAGTWPISSDEITLTLAGTCFNRSAVREAGDDDLVDLI